MRWPESAGTLGVVKALFIFLFTWAVAGFSAVEADDSWRSEFAKESLVAGEVTLPYRIAELGPAGTSPRPLVVFLHGSGERGEDNEAQLKHGLKDLVAWCTAEKRACVALVPQCPPGKRWVELEGDYKNAGEITLPENSGAVTTAVFELIEKVVKEKSLDPGRVYLTGLSLGGYGTFAMLARRPDLFAAGMPVCGGGDLRTAKKFKEVPLWVFHGAADPVVPVATSRKMVQALVAAGGKPKYREYPEAGHDCWSATYADAEVWTWLFAQKR